MSLEFLGTHGARVQKDGGNFWAPGSSNSYIGIHGGRVRKGWKRSGESRFGPNSPQNRLREGRGGAITKRPTGLLKFTGFEIYGFALHVGNLALRIFRLPIVSKGFQMVFL